MDKRLIKELQRAMNEAGHTPKFSETGNYGTKTEVALPLYAFTVTAKRLDIDPVIIIPAPVPKPALTPTKGDYFGASWVGANNDLLGLNETDSRLNARFVPHWAKVGLSGYKTLVGNSHAHCALVLDANYAAVGVKGPGSAAASKTSTWGKKCPFWFGAALDNKHKGGGRHTCIFLYWIDEKKKLAATKDSNRSNKYGIFETDLSGKGDTLPAGPRWPKDYPDGQFVSMADVLNAYPELKVGSKGTGGSTR